MVVSPIIPLFTRFLYIQTVVGNGISEPSTVLGIGLLECRFCCLNQSPEAPWLDPLDAGESRIFCGFNGIHETRMSSGYKHVGNHQIVFSINHIIYASMIIKIIE